MKKSRYVKKSGGVGILTIILWFLNLILFILTLGFIWIDQDPFLRDTFRIKK